MGIADLPFFEAGQNRGSYEGFGSYDTGSHAEKSVMPGIRCHTLYRAGEAWYIDKNDGTSPIAASGLGYAPPFVARFFTVNEDATVVFNTPGSEGVVEFVPQGGMGRFHTTRVIFGGTTATETIRINLWE